MKNEGIKVRELPAEKRSANFEEVVLGYTREQALDESRRCLQCKNPACIDGCPVGIDIKGFINYLSQGDFERAYFKIREKNNFPSICGRVCPAEYQCRRGCVLTKRGSPFADERAINIHFLERFLGDYGLRHSLRAPVLADKKLSGFKAAVVGSGPAGLCAAGELARQGVKVVVFESLHKAGGVLRYGIPPFRLAREILDFEIDYLAEAGVEIIPNFVIGRIKTMEELFSEGYAAVFLGLGAGVPSFLGIEGENSCNIYSANEFLTRINLMQAYKFPEFHTPVNIGRRIVVIGGGNTAMDAARTALRLQKMNGIVPNTTVLYRRTEMELPARRLEIEHAREEGVNFRFLVKPKAFISDENGYVKKISLLECRLGEPDKSGRRRPVEIEGSDFEIESDMAVIAVGLKANEVLTKLTPQLKTDNYADVVVNPQTMQTSIEGVFAGGDIVGGEGTVIEAMGMAKRAAKGIIDYLLARGY